MVKKVAVLCVALSVTGCQLMQPAGVAEYTVEPFRLSDGSLVCCKVEVYNSKDIGAVAIDFKKTGNDYEVNVTESTVDASSPMGIQAETNATIANTLSNVTGLLQKAVP